MPCTPHATLTKHPPHFIDLAPTTVTVTPHRFTAPPPPPPPPTHTHTHTPTHYPTPIRLCHLPPRQTTPTWYQPYNPNTPNLALQTPLPMLPAQRLCLFLIDSLRLSSTKSCKRDKCWMLAKALPHPQWHGYPFSIGNWPKTQNYSTGYDFPPPTLHIQSTTPKPRD